MRPSYIIGAVRDNLLNHMVGFAVYGAVQAHLGEPLEFPGDYLAWDREFCQSKYTSALTVYCILCWHSQPHLARLPGSPCHHRLRPPQRLPRRIRRSPSLCREPGLQRLRRHAVHVVPFLSLPRLLVRHLLVPTLRQPPQVPHHRIPLDKNTARLWSPRRDALDLLVVRVGDESQSAAGLEGAAGRAWAEDRAV